MWTTVGVLLTIAAFGLGSSVLRESSSTTDADVPQLLFSVPLVYKTSQTYPSVRSVLVTSGGKILIADKNENELKMTSFECPNIVEDVYEIYMPKTMLELQDGTVALTMAGSKIAIMRIVGTTLQLVRHIYTDESYEALAQGPEDNTLLVSTKEYYHDIDEETEYARIDVIDMDGTRLRTLIQNEYPVEKPFFLRRYGDDLYVSDDSLFMLSRVNVHTGEVNTSVGSLDFYDLGLRYPGSFDIDDKGTLYIATGGAACERANKIWCILQVRQSGAWQVMDDFLPQYMSPEGPPALVLTSSQIIMAFGNWSSDVTLELTSYSLPGTRPATSTGAKPDCEPVTTSTRQTSSTMTTPTTSSSSSPEP